MKIKSVILASILIAAGNIAANSLSVYAAKKVAPVQKKEFPKLMTGLETNVSVQLLRVVRANVPEFGRNNIVVVQYRLRKEGANKPGTIYKGWFEATDIKARDPALGSAYEVIRGVHEHSTYSQTAMTNSWQTGQTGDGYAWFKIPDDVKRIDLFFPETRPFNNIPIEVPKA